MSPLTLSLVSSGLLVHTSTDMRWQFKPQQSEVRVVPGESALAFYTATNPTDEAITGVFVCCVYACYIASCLSAPLPCISPPPPSPFSPPIFLCTRARTWSSHSRARCGWSLVRAPSPSTQPRTPQTKPSQVVECVCMRVIRFSLHLFKSLLLDETITGKVCVHKYIWCALVPPSCL